MTADRLKIEPLQPAGAVVGAALRFARRLVVGPVQQPDWRAVLEREPARWQAARDAARSGPRILIGTSTGSHLSVTPVESLLAVALTLRGADVEILLCDEVLPACLMCESTQLLPPLMARYGPRYYNCRFCYEPAAAMYGALGLNVRTYSQMLEPADLALAEQVAANTPVEQIGHYRHDGLAVGEHALAGALRYFARATLDGETWGEPVLRRYFKASLLSVFATHALMRQRQHRTAVFHHGIYVPQGLLGEVARSLGVAVVNWNPAYRKRCFIFSHQDTYHHTLMSEPTELWQDLQLTPPLEAQLMAYLKSRWEGSQDWIWFQHESPKVDASAIAQELGVDFSRPCIGLLTNVMWDAQLHYPANAFPNMLEWVLQSIGHFQKRPELQLLIRIHPAEVTSVKPSRQPLLAEIQKAFPQLPPNVFVIPPESKVSTYAAMLQCDAAIIYGTKTGVELTSLGIPVIVAGEAWIRNKGVTLDARSVQDYFQILDRLPLGRRLDDATVHRARKYAFHFFFRRMIPLESMKPTGKWPPYRVQVSKLDDLMPGGCRGLDVICDGILHGKPFVYPAEVASTA